MCGYGTAAQLRLSEHRLDGGPVTHVYLYVEDVDSIIPAGMAVKDCPWGMREARLIDPDGNEVRVGSPIREPKTSRPSLMSSKIVSPAVPPHGPTAGVISQPCDFVTSEPLLSLAGVQSHES